MPQGAIRSNSQSISTPSPRNDNQPFRGTGRGSRRTFLERRTWTRTSKSRENTRHIQGRSEPKGQNEQPNRSGHDDSVKWYDKSTINWRHNLDQIENCCELFDFSKMTLNKFYESYYGVINLSNLKLDVEDLEILGKGLKFCPTPANIDHGALKESLDKFFRRCALKLHFAIQNDIHEDMSEEHDTPEPFSHPDLKLPSTFSPQMPSNLEHINYLILQDLLTFKPKRCKHNLTSNQLSRLFNLSENEHIIFKKADKGSNIVIWDKVLYKEEAHRQLKNTNYYMKLPNDISHKVKEKVDKLTTKMFENREINEKTFLYLMEGGTRTSVFYMLPKIHKNRQNPPGRPIVSSVNSPTEKISQMTDILLRPWAQKGRSFICDTPDFIGKIKDIKLEPNDWFLTMDVTNLYTNIPHNESIEKVHDVIKERTNMYPTNESILKMLSLILKYNVFRFEKDYYLQINGTAMGTRVAPTYAIIFMNWLEENYICNRYRNLRYWFRFIDDIWAIFRGTEAEIIAFKNFCNSIHPTIKFTMEFSKDKVVFLDLITSRTIENNIKTEVYETH